MRLEQEGGVGTSLAGPAIALPRKPVTAPRPATERVTALRVLLRLRDTLRLRPGHDVLGFWVTLVHSGLAGPAEVFEAFMRSRDFRDGIAPLARLYFAVFRRFPDYGGLRYWIGQRRSGMAMTAVAEAFAHSAELVRAHGPLDSRSFAALILRNTCSGEPAADSIDYWTERLDTGKAARGALACDFIRNPDYVHGLAAELHVAMMYLILLRRAPDPEGFEYFVAARKGSRRRGALARMLDSAEFHGQFEARREAMEP